MNVELYVYDLSQGLARQYSQALTGVQIDAIYHTAIVFGGVEYFFGQGIHRKVPGSTHHGRPMKIVQLGTTELPLDVIDEYIESLESIYTPESYDLFLHNCNNFTQDVSVFLVGKSIPDEIRNLPETFLRTPIGQMLRGQIDQSMRRMTQAPDAAAGQSIRARRQSNGHHTPAPSRNGVVNHEKYVPAAFSNGTHEAGTSGRVHYPQNTKELDSLLKAAENTCAAIFFTSATCPPCKIVYPAYDQLAEEAGSKATLIKVDVSKVYDIAMRYQVRATPTFMTFLKGKKDQEWSGAHEGTLLGNIRLLIQMANPAHLHSKLRLPSFEQKIKTPIMYARVPPIDKLLGKLGSAAHDAPIQSLIIYIREREKNGLVNTPIPNLAQITTYFASTLSTSPPGLAFPLIDLLRLATADPRISSYLATEPSHRTLNTIAPSTKDFSSVPYNIQAPTLQLLCNLFGSPVFIDSALPSLLPNLNNIASQTLLSPNPTARSLSAALIYNTFSHTHNERLASRPDSIDASQLPDLEAALVDAVVTETENKETLHSLLMALGVVLYMGPEDSSVRELCSAMDVRGALKEKASVAVFKGEEGLLREVGELLSDGDSRS